MSCFGLGLGDGVGNQMLRVPELPGAAVANTSQSAAARRTPVGGKNRLPDDQHVKARVVIALQKLADCGGPPQAEGSSGGNQQDEASACGRLVEG